MRSLRLRLALDFRQRQRGCPQLAVYTDKLYIRPQSQTSKSQSVRACNNCSRSIPLALTSRDKHSLWQPAGYSRPALEIRRPLVATSQIHKPFWIASNGADDSCHVHRLATDCVASVSYYESKPSSAASFNYLIVVVVAGGALESAETTFTCEQE